jgi:hypothetical protein
LRRKESIANEIIEALENRILFKDAKVGFMKKFRVNVAMADNF